MQLERLVAHHRQESVVKPVELLHKSAGLAFLMLRQKSKVEVEPVKATLAAFTEMARYVPAFVSTLVLHYH